MIDIIFIVLMILAGVKGFTRGFIIALFSFVAIIIGLAAAMKLSATVADHLQHSIHGGGRWLPFLSFLLVMVAVIFLVRTAAAAVDKSVKWMMLGWINRLGGILFYAALYTIVFSVILYYADKMHLVTQESLRASACYPFIRPWGPGAIRVFGALVPAFKEIFAQLENFFDATARAAS